jgi:excisionase family DNA binding protein
MTNGVLTANEAAERLDVSPRTVRRMAADGRLHPRDKWPGRTGGFLFDEREVDQLAEGGPATEREKAS